METPAASSNLMGCGEAWRPVSCLAKSLSSQANKIACSLRLNGSQMNLPRGRGGINGGHFSCRGSSAEAQDKWMAVRMQQCPAIVSPKSGN